VEVAVAHYGSTAGCCIGLFLMLNNDNICKQYLSYHHVIVRHLGYSAEDNVEPDIKRYYNL